MTEKKAGALATVLGGQVERSMPMSRTWGLLATRTDGRFMSIEDHAGWAYPDRKAFDSYQEACDQDVVETAEEWGEWDGGERWARGLGRVLGSEDYWHSGGGIWLVFHTRPDGRLAVIGSESGAVYASRDAFESDEDGDGGENFYFV